MIELPEGYLAPLYGMPIDTAFACRSCGETKLAGFFYRDFSITDGFMPDCKACVNVGKQLAREGKKRQQRVRAAEKWLDVRLNEPQVYLWRLAQDRALKKGVPFSITPRDVVIPPVCPVLGIELQFAKGGPAPGSPTIDRVIPERGYVPGNIRVISYKANTLKWDATAVELRAVADYIDAHLRALNS